MTVLKGHFDGKGFVADEPVPVHLSPDTPVRILIDGASGSSSARHVLARIAELAINDDDLPPDYAEQHEHYVKGTPRK